MRNGFAGEPLSGENRAAYCFSKRCQGTIAESWTQRFFASSLPSKGNRNSEKLN
jgi:hypothetical protein